DPKQEERRRRRERAGLRSVSAETSVILERGPGGKALQASQSAIYRVEAFNTAVASENRIHDDETARRFGFRGGLVPGVEVYAYMAHMPFERFGEAWLERGGMECRFLKPVYDGHVATISAAEDAAGLSLRVESDGELCAKGQAWLREPEGAGPGPPALPPANPPLS